MNLVIGLTSNKNLLFYFNYARAYYYRLKCYNYNVKVENQLIRAKPTVEMGGLECHVL